MRQPNKLEITRSCWLEHYSHCAPSLCYIERQADSYYSDGETEIDIDKDTAIQIIEWLAEEHNLSITTSEVEK